MTIRTTLITTGLIAASLVSGAAQAALQGRDLDGNAATVEAYYDTDLDITWLSTASYNATNIISLNWTNANAWAANLSFTDGINVYDNWRLPTTQQPDVGCNLLGYNCTGGELGYMFYTELGGVAGSSIATTHNANYSLFTNLLGGSYWSDTLYLTGVTYAWAFDMSNGYQSTDHKTNAYLVWAVSPGDVGAVAAVPEAQTYALMLAGLGLIGWRARRRG